MKYFQLLLLFGVAYLAIVAAEDSASDDVASADEVNAVDSGSACQCTREYKPVCGSDGVTYSNKCLYECENNQRVENGQKELTIKCPAACNQCPKTSACVCTKEYKPVCGSDGNTYGNTCQFNCENERRRNAGEPQIVTRCKNVCSKCPPECVCPLNYSPVCGTDGVTYGNQCNLDCENKRRVTNGEPKIYLQCENECNKCPPECACPLTYIPVCGSDGVTYSNECAFDCENDRRKSQGQPLITMSCQTACDSCAVPL